MTTNFRSQPTNLNDLKENAFSFSLSKAPTTTYKVTGVILPGLTGQGISMGNPLSKIQIPGDELNYDNLNIRFIVDEDMQNWRELHTWMTQLYTAKNSADLTTLKADTITGSNLGGGTTDATLTIRTNKQNPNIRFKFQEVFPLSIGSLSFNSTVTDENILECDAVFAYTIFDVDIL